MCEEVGNGGTFVGAFPARRFRCVVGGVEDVPEGGRGTAEHFGEKAGGGGVAGERGGANWKEGGESGERCWNAEDMTYCCWGGTLGAAMRNLAHIKVFSRGSTYSTVQYVQYYKQQCSEQ